MSGGFFDYKQYAISEIIDSMQNVVDNNSDESLNEYGVKRGRFYSENTIATIKDAILLLEAGAALTQRIDYLLEGDDSEDNFHRRIEEDFTRMMKAKE